jgi:hypothetical protein
MNVLLRHFLFQLIAGVLSRGQNISTIPLLDPPERTLKLFVENQGRVNFGNFTLDVKVDTLIHHGLKLVIIFHHEIIVGIDWRATIEQSYSLQLEDDNLTAEGYFLGS